MVKIFYFQRKYSPWEGATRNRAFIYSSLIKQPGKIVKGYFHTSDILPTLASAADIDNVGNVDGLNVWDELVNGDRLQRNQVISVIDEVDGIYGLIDGTWKIINGTRNSKYDKYSEKIVEYKMVEENYVSAVKRSRVKKNLKEKLKSKNILELREKLKISCHDRKNPLNDCKPAASPCLYNIHIDPCERHNLAKHYPEIVEPMSRDF